MFLRFTECRNRSCRKNVSVNRFLNYQENQKVMHFLFMQSNKTKMSIKNPISYLDSAQHFISFSKRFISDVWEGSDYVSEIFLLAEFACYYVTAIFFPVQVKAKKNLAINYIKIFQNSTTISNTELIRSNDTNWFLRKLVSEAPFTDNHFFALIFDTTQLHPGLLYIERLPQIMR